ncbi:DNRLRE domain-containing protein [Streptosporangium sp. NPDC000239]|uniref:DNRLRE domain-containing protein n=1 Tax=unclassified Streptosporangium TaxID=2632669 RepID=UPI00331C4159
MRISLGGSLGRLALGVTTVAALTGGTAVQALAAPGAGQPQTVADDDARDAVEQAAAEQAASLGRAVPVPGLTDETSTTVANPDGSFTSTITSGPSQVRRNGQWVAVDTDLVEEGGALRPRAARADVRISGGGDGPLATLTDDAGRVFSLQWPKPLPKPVVKGNVATFTDAAGPAADLVVTALPTGFRHDVVLRERPSGPLELRIPVQTTGVALSESPAGRLLLTDTEGTDNGEVVASASQPLMWDSRGHGKPRGKAVSVIDTRVETENGSTTLVLKPDQAFLSNPATVYPVTVDPTTTLPIEADTDVATSWNSHPGDVLIIAGTMLKEDQSGSDVMRSLLRFDTHALNRKKVLSARLGLWNVETSACGRRVGSGLTVERLTGAWNEHNLTWANKPPATSVGATTNREGRGRTWTAPCRRGAGYLRWEVTSIARAWAAGAPNHGVQLRSANEAEADNWRAFAASENKEEGVGQPTLTVTYRRH